MNIPLLAGTCAVIPFYGAKPDPSSLAEFYNIASRWFNDLGYVPDVACVKSRSRSSAYVKYASIDRKLRRWGFEGIVNLEVSCLLPNAEFPANDFRLKLFFNAPNSMYYIAGDSTIVGLSEQLIPVAASIVSAIKPSYGIGYVLPRSRGPHYYASGINFSLSIDDAVKSASGQEYERGLNVGRWGHTYMPAKVWEWGYVRDVYPWNFLNKKQLAMKVQGISLEHWIGEDHSRGTLKPMDHDLVLWELPAEGVASAQSALLKAGVIFQWDLHQHLLPN